MKNTMRAILTVSGLLILASIVAHAEQGDRELLQDNFQIWAPGPNGKAAFEKSLSTLGEIMTNLAAPHFDRVKNWSIQMGQSTPNNPARATFEAEIPTFRGKVHGDVALSVRTINCRNGQGKGYLFDFDASRTDSRVSNNYNHFQIEACGLHTRSDGMLLMDATAYAVEGPDLGWLRGPAVLEGFRGSVAWIQQELNKHFEKYANSTDSPHQISTVIESPGDGGSAGAEHSAGENSSARVESLSGAAIN